MVESSNTNSGGIISTSSESETNLIAANLRPTWQGLGGTILYQEDSDHVSAIDAFLNESSLNEQEQLLQKMIIRNFMGIKRVKRIEDLGADKLMSEYDVGRAQSQSCMMLDSKETVKQKEKDIYSSQAVMQTADFSGK